MKSVAAGIYEDNTQLSIGSAAVSQKGIHLQKELLQCRRKKMISVAEFQRNFSKAIREGFAAVFAGAGLSRQSGFVNWKELLRGIAVDLSLDINQEYDLVALAQYSCNEKRSRSHLNDLILNQFIQQGKANASLKILSELPISTYWTTNYDHLIEDALRAQGKRVDVKITPDNLAAVLESRDAVVYKMHGDYTRPSECVITKDDYEVYNQTRQLFSTALQADLVSHTFLFIGFSFDDPNLSYILGRIRALLNNNIREHYCFFEKAKQRDNETDDEFDYRKHKLGLRIHDLQRYGISAVMLDSYSEIPVVLEGVKKQVKSNCVFISGSAEVYGAWEEENAYTLIRYLAKRLCESSYRIVTGHGKGIGSFVISSVLDKYGNSIHEIERHLSIRAFPFQDKNRSDYAELVTEYRSGFFQQAGVAIFLFGNKSIDGKISIAPGAMQEFSLAKEHGCFLIPIASTGYAAQEVFNIMKESKSDYPYISDWNMLETCKDPYRLVEHILKTLDTIQRSF